MPTEIEVLEAQVKKIDDENGASYKQLQEEVGLTMDTTAMRLNMLIESLREFWGEENYLKFELAFQTKIKSTLDETWEKVRKHKTKSRLAIAEKPSKLFGPDGKILK